MVEDDYLLEIFERAAGDPPSAREALEQLRPRIRRAHRRRAVIRGSTALVALVVLGGLVSNTTSHPSRDVRVGSTGTTATFDSTTTVAPSTTVPAPGRGQDGSPSVDPPTPSGEPSGGVSGGDRVAGRQVQNRETATPGPTAEPSAKGSTAPKPPSSRDSTSGAVTTTSGSVSTGSPAPQTTTFDGEGGTIEVQYTDTSMSLSSVLPSPGWSVAKTKLDGSNIEVSFVPESGSGDSNDINVHLDGGEPVVDRPPDTTASADQLSGG